MVAESTPPPSPNSEKTPPESKSFPPLTHSPSSTSSSFSQSPINVSVDIASLHPLQIEDERTIVFGPGPLGITLTLCPPGFVRCVAISPTATSTSMNLGDVVLSGAGVSVRHHVTDEKFAELITAIQTFPRPISLIVAYSSVSLPLPPPITPTPTLSPLEIESQIVGGTILHDPTIMSASPNRFGLQFTQSSWNSTSASEKRSIIRIGVVETPVKRVFLSGGGNALEPRLLVLFDNPPMFVLLRRPTLAEVRRLRGEGHAVKANFVVEDCWGLEMVKVCLSSLTTPTSLGDLLLNDGNNNNDSNNDTTDVVDRERSSESSSSPFDSRCFKIITPLTSIVLQVPKNSNSNFEFETGERAKRFVQSLCMHKIMRG